jgi:hypothetical protein
LEGKYTLHRTCGEAGFVSMTAVGLACRLMSA